MELANAGRPAVLTVDDSTFFPLPPPLSQRYLAAYSHYKGIRDQTSRTVDQQDEPADDDQKGWLQRSDLLKDAINTVKGIQSKMVRVSVLFCLNWKEVPKFSSGRHRCAPASC